MFECQVCGEIGKTKIELANKAVNFLCVLGLLEKVPNSGGTKGTDSFWAIPLLKQGKA